MASVTRRNTLKYMVAASAAATTACSKDSPPAETRGPQPTRPAKPVVLATVPLPAGTTPWPTRDPFLFCVHHDDRYPQGNGHFGPATSLEGRQLGSDFAGKDGWRMYHGRSVPGFPRHPHRGFETVTVVREGLLDHSDSLGAAARYGGGDVQWLTAGSGIQHAEMFPLLHREQANPLELFQIWMNLPRSDKLVAPHFSMLWRESIPMRQLRDGAGRTTQITVIAGHYDGSRPPSPPPNSWAARPEHDVAIWALKMEPGARFRLPAARAGVDRSLYFFIGSELGVGGASVQARHRVDLEPRVAVVLENGMAEAELLLLQGRPIAEPIARYGPFVMTTDQEIRQAYADFNATQFGGWPWDSHDPVHGKEPARFARHADGRLDRPA